MKAITFHGTGDVRVETVADPKIMEATDAVVRITTSAVCGSDLHPYHGRGAAPGGPPLVESGSVIRVMGVGRWGGVTRVRRATGSSRRFRSPRSCTVSMPADPVHDHGTRRLRQALRQTVPRHRRVDPRPFADHVREGAGRHGRRAGLFWATSSRPALRAERGHPPRRHGRAVRRGAGGIARAAVRAALRPIARLRRGPRGLPPEARRGDGRHPGGPRQGRPGRRAAAAHGRARPRRGPECVGHEQPFGRRSRPWLGGTVLVGLVAQPGVRARRSSRTSRSRWGSATHATTWRR
jgi:hypothetical protein